MVRRQGSENTKSSCSGLRMRDMFKFGVNILHEKSNLEES